MRHLTLSPPLSLFAHAGHDGALCDRLWPDWWPHRGAAGGADEPRAGGPHLGGHGDGQDLGHWLGLQAIGLCVIKWFQTPVPGRILCSVISSHMCPTSLNQPFQCSGEATENVMIYPDLTDDSSISIICYHFGDSSTNHFKWNQFARVSKL